MIKICNKPAKTTSTFVVERMPVEVRLAYRAACASRGLKMRDTTISLLKSFARLGPLNDNDQLILKGIR